MNTTDQPNEIEALWLEAHEDASLEIARFYLAGGPFCSCCGVRFDGLDEAEHSAEANVLFTITNERGEAVIDRGTILERHVNLRGVGATLVIVSATTGKIHRVADDPATITRGFI